MDVRTFPDFPIFRSGEINAYAEPLLPVFDLWQAYSLATTWEEVLSLHTEESAAYIVQIGMHEWWEEAQVIGAAWQITFGGLVSLGNEARTATILTQSLPTAVEGPDFEEFGAYWVHGYRALASEWKFDFTLRNMPLGRIIGSTPPSQLTVSASEWYERRLGLVTWLDMVEHAEADLVFQPEMEIEI